MVVSVIFSVLFAICFILFLTGTFKVNPLLEKISLYLLLPLSSGIIIPFFTVFLPDSLNALIISTLAVLFSALIPVTYSLTAKLKIRLDYFFYFAATIFWIFFYHSSVYLYRIPAFIWILTLVLTLSLFIFLIFSLKLKVFKEIVIFFIQNVFCFTLFFLTLITLLASPNLSGSLCISGSIILSAYVILKKVTEIKPFKLHFLLINLLLITGTCLLYSGTVLLQY